MRPKILKRLTVSTGIGTVSYNRLPRLNVSVEGISIQVNEENGRHFYAKIDGPEGTPYEGGEFRVEMYLPEDFPNAPPKCLFRTKIWHVNIDDKGRICLSTLKP